VPIANRIHAEPTPRERLEEYWRKTMLLMLSKRHGEDPATFRESVVDELEDRVIALKQWADHQHATTGVFPDAEVSEFLDDLELCL
jgi:hypothetical protein